MSSHKKHITVSKLTGEKYSRKDFAFVGAPCEKINRCIDSLFSKFSKEYAVVCISGNHDNSEDEYIKQNELIVKSSKKPFFNDYSLKKSGQYFDVALINGNHFQGERQIVFLDSEKEESLRKRKDQLTNVLAFVSVDNQGIYPWLHTINPAFSDLPLFEINAIEGLSKLILSHITSAIPGIKGLVLSGGKSKRMGFDKSQVKFFKHTQEVHMVKLLSKLGLSTYLSKGYDYQGNENDIPVLKDKLIGYGPFGAIFTAFQHERNCAWLVVGCDMPFVNMDILQRLLNERDVSKAATAIKARSKDFPEPLLAIYEPKGFNEMLSFLSLGYSCPRKVLINTDIKIIEIEDDRIVMNVNSPEELDQAKKILDSNQQ